MQHPTIRPWKTLSKETILTNKFLTVEIHSVELPDGRVISDWSKVILPDAVIVLAQAQDGRFLSFRQTKYAIDGITLAPVGGMLEPGETPLEAAKRELLEETGFVSGDWLDMGSYVTDPNRGICTFYLYLARQAYPVAAPDADDLEDQQLVMLERSELLEALLRGEYKAVEWTAAIALALLHLDGTA